MTLHKIWPWLTALMFGLVFFTGSAFSEDVSQSDSLATQAVITDQISAFQAQDHERAFSHAAPRIRDIFKTTENFIRMVKGGYSPLYDPDSYLFGRNTELYGEVYQEVIATDKKGKQWQAVYTLKKQPDGSWKITGVKMEPYTGAAT